MGAYIWSFIIIAYGFNSRSEKKHAKSTKRFRLATRYRTAFIGLLTGIGLYFLRGYQLVQVEPLLHSFVFAFVFHKLLLDGVVKFLRKQFAPNSDSYLENPKK